MTHKISPVQVGTRLDQLTAELAELSRSAAAKLIEEGGVTVNGDTLPKNYRMREGDEAEITLPPPAELDVAPEDIPLDIVYQDAHLAVINKPKGMVVHPGAGHLSGTLVNGLMHHMKGSLSGINGVLRPGIVHRLDKDTSGLLAIAKTDQAHAGLSEQLASRTMKRIYHALVVGNVKTDSGRIDAPIGRHKTDRTRMAVTHFALGGREAVTDWKVLELFEGFTLLELSLHTGRTHQIRVHLASRGMPVMGDVTYGGGKTLFERQNKAILEGQCLHAMRLTFIHPHTGEEMSFEANYPPYFAAMLAKLNNCP